MQSRRGVAVASLVVVLVALALPAARPQGPAAAGALEIRVLSNRADLISGDDALVEVVVPGGVDPAAVTVDVGGRDATDAFAVRADGRFTGLVTGLVIGTNEVTARTGDGRSSSVTIENHPNGGPVFSGPQIQPWECQDDAVDAQCNQPVSYEFLYQPADALTFALRYYDPANPPTDIAMTTTDEGVTVPFVIRIERGYQDRDQYKIATLFQPGLPWEPWAPQPQWNHKLLITHGGGCGASYGAGGAPDVLTNGNIPGLDAVVDVPVGVNPTVALSRGFAVMSTALNNNGHNCNIVVQAESMMMAKEHLVETYGPLRYTIGTGCSGGALTQQQVANAYPGIYQGLIVTCAYPDTLTPGAQFADYHLLRLYFENPDRWGPGIVWTPLQWAAVEGHLSHVNAIAADEGLFKSAVDPTNDCRGVTDEQRYDPTSNPGGVRCSVLDYMINVLGPRPARDWSPMEQAAGRGFAGAPLGNEGIQYGLGALRLGLITPAQFVDLNEAIGGLDIDVRPVAARVAGDATALRNAYRSGAINMGNNLSSVAIIDHAGPDPGVAHDAIHTWWMRARLARQQGHFDNHVIWFGAAPLIGDPNYYVEALLAMDRWLAAVEADGTDRPLADKVVGDRPADIHDRCSQVSAVGSGDGMFVPTASTLLEPTLREALDPLAGAANPVLDPAFGVVIDPVLNLVCGPGLVGDLLQTRLGTPRSVAGDGPTSDVNACALRPPQRADYPVTLGDADWVRLQAVFAGGVCDWDAPGIGETETVPWLTYQDGAGQVIYGGCPLPPPPTGSGGGLVSAAFAMAPSVTATDVCPARAIAPPTAGTGATTAAAGAPAASPAPASTGTAAPGGAADGGPAGSGATGSLPGTGWDPSGVLPALLAAAALLSWRLGRRAASHR